MTNTSSSCFDLIFTWNSSLITKSAYADSCHHSIVLVRWISTFLSLLHEFWDYNKADKKNIQKSIKTFTWARLFINLTINERVEFFPNTLINIFKNYIPNKKVKLEHGEALWINKNKVCFIKDLGLQKDNIWMVKCKVIITCY